MEQAYSQDQLLQALRIARLAYWDYDVVTDKFTFNDQFYSLLRTSVEKEGGYTMSSSRYAQRFVHPNDAHIVAAEIQKALGATDPNYSQELDHRIIYADGGIGYFAVHIRIEKDARGRIIKTHGANMDITDRKRAEEDLRRTVSLLQSSLNSTADGLMVVDRSGRIVWYNERFVTLWQMPQEILDSRDDDAALAHVMGQLKNPDEFMRKIRNLYAHPEAESFEVLEFKNGRVFERYSCPQRLDGVPIGRVWSFRNVTERKELESQLRQSQKMHAFGQLAAGVAHDFNNILTVILGNLSLLQTNQLSETDQASALNQVSDAANKAAKLTRQLLTFSRRQPLQSKDLDLNEVVTSIIKMLQRLIGEHIALEARYSPGGASVHVDPGMMEQVLMNLAVNSRDAMPKGGRLVIETALVTVDDNHASSNPKARRGEYVRLSVADTGEGIAPEDLPHIFEPFFTTKEVGKGTGLGLATVFGIVEQHQGWIEVESRLNHGTTFHIYLPCSATSTLPQVEPRVASQELRGSETILLVEDEIAVQQLMQKVLERHGYQVHAASSGARALEIWQEHQQTIDMLVTDMVMPEGMSGRELADRLLSEEPGLKVIYCSGYTDDVLGEDSLLQDKKYFLEKPFQLSKLLQTVRDCADSK